MQEITINFGLTASEKFPAVARARVLATPQCVKTSLPSVILAALEGIGCTILNYRRVGSNSFPTLVVTLEYPWQAEIDACKPPSVLKYEPYMRLYELAAYFAQDAVAVVPDGEQGLLVGAGAAKWGAFDSNKFITLD